jgi:hypothetical protein
MAFNASVISDHDICANPASDRVIEFTNTKGHEKGAPGYEKTYGSGMRYRFVRI